MIQMVYSLEVNNASYDFTSHTLLLRRQQIEPENLCFHPGSEPHTVSLGQSIDHTRTLDTEQSALRVLFYFSAFLLPPQ
ncbi:hypothetical protein THF1A12_1300003 [Vibrio jasicida]|uniref:Uncharacterized protein n=1 Tax=Vibrio jasicida TaxID=766224 RepID=A0AAU9QIN4_9VIBR|nr:hypothetical protein THF1A12_1300003 [Vibrio jasicida]